MRKKNKKISYVFFFVLVAKAHAVFAQWSVSNYDQTNLPKTSLSRIISNIAFWLLAIFGFVAVIGFVISGIIYLISTGEEKVQERAKRAMIYSITGVVVGLVGLVVIISVNYFLGGGSISGNFINSAANSPAAGASVPNPSGIIRDAAGSPDTGSEVPALPSASERSWAPTTDMYTDPNETRPENFPF